MSISLDLSVIVITLNEEDRLERCLNSLPSGCEICVLDSGSTDRTVAIAKSFGAKVATHSFDRYDAQKNRALSLASRTWVLSLDADEMLSPQLAVDIVRCVEAGKLATYRLSRRLVFMGKALRFGKTLDHPIRLFLREGSQFEGAIHEKVISPYPAARIPSTLLHFSYRSLEGYFETFNKYTTRIAHNHLKNGKTLPTRFGVSARFFAEFINRYWIRLGFLDGYPGFVYALLSSTYAFTKYAKLLELHEQNKN